MGVGCECFANLISLCFFIVFGSRVYFLLGSRPFFVNEGSVVSCDLSVLMGGCELKSFYSMMLSSISRLFILIEDASVPLPHSDIVGTLDEMQSMWDFPGDSVAKTPCSQCRGPGFHSW